MASNDSSAAVAAVVNAVTPTLPQTQSRAPEAAQANLGSQSKQANAAAVPVSETLPPASANDAKAEPQPPAVASTESPSTNIPTPPAESPVKEMSQTITSNPPSKEEATNANTITESSMNSVINKEEVKEAEKKPKNDKSAVTPMEVDKEPVVPAPMPALSTNNTQPPSVKKEQQTTSVPETKPSSGSDQPAKPLSDKPPVSLSDKPPNSTSSSIPESSIKNTTASPKPVATIKPMVESSSSSAAHPGPETTKAPPQDASKMTQDNHKPNNKRSAEDADEPEKRMKPSGSKENKIAEQVLEQMEKTFEQRRKVITKQMPTIPELKSMYPELFMGKQLLLEFQRITKIDIDQKIQEFCVRYATAVIEMARDNKAAAPVLARWEHAKQENENLKQYWDMVTALCLLPLHFGENFVEMVLEIDEDEEVKAQGKIVPTLVARGNIFCTDEFFLIAENTIVQEFEEFTIAFASLYSSYWVFNMVYPETIESTYNYIQRCIVRQREPGAISTACKNFTKSLQKWNKKKEGK